VNPIYLAPWRIDPVVRDEVNAGGFPLPVAALARAIAGALDAARAPSPASIGLILSDDAELAELNQVHLGHVGPTDVLSFPLLPPESFPPHSGDPDRGPALRAGDATAFGGPPGRRVHLGDIVVSVERAAEQAAEGTEPPADLNASADYKRHLADELTRRTLRTAVDRIQAGRAGDQAGDDATRGGNS
jgi:ssRNA-specific RNase YbeY (16S rRNA maturation enzyme)